MIVEFIGAPGAGKTTLLSVVAERLAVNNLQAYDVVGAARLFAGRTLPGRIVQRLAPPFWRHQLLWQVFYRSSQLSRRRFRTKHPELLNLVEESQRDRPVAAAARQRRVTYWYDRHIGYYQFLHDQIRPGETLLFDEGFLHRVVQLFTSIIEAPTRNQIAAYVDLLPRPDLVVYTCASRETCEQRIYDRGLRLPWQDSSPAEISQFVTNAHRAVLLAVARARHNGWNIVEVDNDRDDMEINKVALSRQIELQWHMDGASEFAREGILIRDA